MKPPFNITLEILNLCTKISRLLGQYEGVRAIAPQPILRKRNRVKSVQSSLAIEGNVLSEEQVTALINNKRVLGPQKDILEVKNAIKTYENLKKYNIYSIRSLLRAHKILMTGLTEDAGKLRQCNVGVVAGEKVIHMAPPYKQVPELVENLFKFLKDSKEIYCLIKSSVFHYEFEFIHPFSDGNGRIGRLWQTVILMKEYPIFEFIPIESVIRDRQDEYYQALRVCGKKSDSTEFIVFMLKAINKAVEDFLLAFKPDTQTPETRLKIAGDFFGKKEFSRKEYIQLHKIISTATASRDLIWGVECGLLKKIGEKALTRYCFLSVDKSLIVRLT